MSDGFAARLNTVAYSAQAERLLDGVLLTPGGSLTGRAGKRPGGGLAVTVGGTPEAATVQPGSGVVNTGSNGDGSYRFVIPSAVSKNLTARPSAGTSRIDLVVARIRDADIPALSTALREVQIEVVTGTAGASPSAPAQPAGTVLLARLTVPASGSVTVGGTIPRTVASGGIVPVADAADRDSLLLYPGLTVYREDTGRLEVCDGSTWRRVGGEWSNYTPTWRSGTGPGIPLSVGSAPGAQTGRYRVSDDGTVTATFRVVRGSGAALGSTFHSWDMPPIPPRAFSEVVGIAWINSPTLIAPLALRGVEDSPGVFQVVAYESASSGPASIISNTNHGDFTEIRGQLTYERA